MTFLENVLAFLMVKEMQLFAASFEEMLAKITAFFELRNFVKTFLFRTLVIRLPNLAFYFFRLGNPGRPMKRHIRYKFSFDH